MQMNVAEAKAKLSELVAAAERGEEVVIARGGRPAVRLVPAEHRGVRLGLLEGIVDPNTVPDFLEPIDADELAAWYGDDETETDRMGTDKSGLGKKERGGTS